MPFPEGPHHTAPGYCSMKNNKCKIAYTSLIIAHLLSGCTLKLTTDLSKVIGVENPQQLMASSEAQQIATRIGEGMGTKIMEGEILAEDMGKGLGEVFLKPEQVDLITDPISLDLIEKSGTAAMRAGKLREAIHSFKRTKNLARLEEIALILFDQGNAEEAADLHQYLIDHAWPLRAPYLVAHHVEQQGLATISTAYLKEIDPQHYNAHYTRRGHTILDAISLNEDFVRNNTISKQDMINKLKTSPVIMLADAYFDTQQHDFFLEIFNALYHKDLHIGLEQELERLKDNRMAAEKLHYLPMLRFIEEKGASTFIHGPLPGTNTANPEAVDFFQWDSALAATVSDLVNKNKQVLLIVGSTHASTDHLPFIIEERSAINPVLVVQSPLNMHAEQWFKKHEATRKRLAAWGAGDGSVITIDNDFYLNTPLSSNDYKHYIELFALEPLSTAR